MKSKTLENISFQIKKGENIAIVGENGAGKTTLIKLLCGLYTAGEGQILINGENAADYKNEEYFDLFSPVFQDYSFLPLSIAQNVAAKTEYDKSRVAAALKDAGIYDKIQSFAHGMDTKLIKEVNRDAQDLSGGEAQKLALARALYKDAPVLILDEPTAALDPVAENEVYQRFNTFVKGKPRSTSRTGFPAACSATASRYSTMHSLCRPEHTRNCLPAAANTRSSGMRRRNTT